MRAQASLGVQDASSVPLWGLCFGALEFRSGGEMAKTWIQIPASHLWVLGQVS